MQSTTRWFFNVALYQLDCTGSANATYTGSSPIFCICPLYGPDLSCFNAKMGSLCMVSIWRDFNFRRASIFGRWAGTMSPSSIVASACCAQQMRRSHRAMPKCSLFSLQSCDVYLCVVISHSRQLHWPWFPWWTENIGRWCVPCSLRKFHRFLRRWTASAHWHDWSSRHTVILVFATPTKPIYRSIRCCGCGLWRCFLLLSLYVSTLKKFTFSVNSYELPIMISYVYHINPLLTIYDMSVGVFT